MLLRYQYLEERAEAVRLAVPVRGFPTTHDAPRIATWARPLVSVLRQRVRRPFCRTCRRGRSRILMPDDLAQWEFRYQLFHELAHPLLDVGLGGVVDGASDDERQAYRLIRDADRHEEALADYFVTALRLPSSLIVDFRGDLNEIGMLTGMPWDTIARRQRELKGQVLNLTWVPYWCAGRSYRLEYHAGAEASLLLWEPEADRPAFRFPCDRTNRHKREIRIKADLVALRPKEFAIKWGCYQVKEGPVACAPHPEELPLSISELREWLHDE